MRTLPADRPINSSALSPTAMMFFELSPRTTTTDGSLTTIRFDGTKWTRRYYTIVNGIKRLQTDNNPALTAGTAAWYARKAGGGAMSVTWEAL